jgi:hypothetical protein
LPNDAQNNLYEVLKNYIPDSVVQKRNKEKSWVYGYDLKHDIVVISKDGTLGEVIRINGVYIGLPKEKSKVYKRSSKKSEQYWHHFDYPKVLNKIPTIFSWNEMSKEFKENWIPYIEEEFVRREDGFWFYNNGLKTYITGTHYMYLQWTKIDVGSPDYRESNRIFFIYWEACKADSRCYGMCYLKNRRSGFSFMSSSETVNQATITSDARFGILSKSGSDAKKMFTDKVVPISVNYPFFFKPIQDGMDRPKSELAYRVPAAKLTRKGIGRIDAMADLQGLDTTIDWKNTGDNSYDGEKLKLLVHDESGKWEKPDNILNNWRVTKTCLRLGSKVIGKCMMGSTSNSLEKGGGNFKSLFYDSNPTERNANGQTKSGLYSLFIPMEWNMEGFIDKYGQPVIESPKEAVLGIDNEFIHQSVVNYWENEVHSLKSDSDALNEYYRQFPRTESHAFRDESKNTLFNLSKIYEQIDYNDSFGNNNGLIRGDFYWVNGDREGQVGWSPNPKGKFITSWIPGKELRNNVIKKGNKKHPGNEHMGSFGCDSYDISGVVNGGGSKGALHGMTKFHMEEGPTNAFFLEYISRPPTAELFYEDVLMAIHFYGMPILVENQKPRLLYYLKERGYRPFSISRPDKDKKFLSKSEKELGGIPSSTPVISAHAEALEAYIQQNVGVIDNADYGEVGEIAYMPFNRTLLDWANYDINNRTRFDATVSSGFAIMANQSRVKVNSQKDSKISLNFAKYSNKGFVSEIIKRV